MVKDFFVMERLRRTKRDAVAEGYSPQEWRITEGLFETLFQRVQSGSMFRILGLPVDIIPDGNRSCLMCADGVRCIVVPHTDLTEGSAGVTGADLPKAFGSGLEAAVTSRLGGEFMGEVQDGVAQG
jgi:hypothetical protein